MKEQHKQPGFSQQNNKNLHSPFLEIEIQANSQGNNSKKETKNQENYELNIQLSQSKKAMLENFLQHVKQSTEQNDLKKSTRLQNHRPPHLIIRASRQQSEQQMSFPKTDSLTFSFSTENDRFSQKKLMESKDEHNQYKNGNVMATFNEKGKYMFDSEQYRENNEQIRYLNNFFCQIGLLQVEDLDKQLSQTYKKISKKHEYLKKAGKIRQLQECIKNQYDNQTVSPLYNNKSRNGIIKKLSLNNNKKVTLVTPQNILQLKDIRKKWEIQLKQTIEFLTQGMIFKKYCYNRQKIQLVRVFFSADFRFVCWKRVNPGLNLFFCRCRGKEVLKVQSMLEFQGIAPGLKSRNFQRYLKLNYPLKDNHIFSIMLSERSLDLQAESRQAKSKFINAIKTIKSFINN